MTLVNSLFPQQYNIFKVIVYALKLFKKSRRVLLYETRIICLFLENNIPCLFDRRLEDAEFICPSAAILIKMRCGLHKEKIQLFLFCRADFDYSREIATFSKIQ